MLSPEDQQVQICLLKSNLEEIESSLVVQRSAMPELDAENEERYRETMTALKVSRAQNDQIERLKQENVRLTAKRTQLKHQCEGLGEALQVARENRTRLVGLIKEEELADESNMLRAQCREETKFWHQLFQIQKLQSIDSQSIDSHGRIYEDSLRNKAERFRQTRSFYDEEQMTREFEEVNQSITELEEAVTRRKQVVGDLKSKLETMETDVPENLPAILGKTDLTEKLKSLTNDCEDLRLKLNEMKKKESTLKII